MANSISWTDETWNPTDGCEVGVQHAAFPEVSP